MVKWAANKFDKYIEQMDGSVLGGQPVAYVTSKVVMEPGQHREELWFIVIPQVT